MTDDPEELRKRKERAADIRDQIDRLKRGETPLRPDGPLSPRDSVEERMRDLDRKTRSED